MKQSLRVLFCLLLFCLTFSVTEAVSCGDSPVTVEEHSIPAESLHADISFSVYLPACLDERVIDGYQVIYLLHGQDMDRSIWQAMGLSGIMQCGIAEGNLPLFLIVTPQEDNYLASIFDSGFGQAIIENIIPWVEQHYNTCTERSCRAIGGISRGALWAEKLAFEHPELFGSLGMHSMPGTIFDDQSLYVLASRQDENQHLRISMDVGNQDNYRHEGRKASDQLNFVGYEFTRSVNPGGHDADYWKSQLANYLVWYSENW